VPEIPGLDTARGLANMANKKPLYLNMLRRFVAGQGNAGQAIRDSLAAGDMDKAQRLAHTLKGTARTLGAAEIEALADTLEQAIAFEVAPATIELRLVELELPLAALIAGLQAQLPAEASV
jgi:two-component system sensor histidine kinase/response regulator